MPRVKKYPEGEEEEEEVWTEEEKEEEENQEEEVWNEEEEEVEEAAAAQKPKKKRYRRPLTQAEKDITAARAKGKREWNIENVPGFLAKESKRTGPYQKPIGSLAPEDQAHRRRVKAMWVRKDRAKKAAIAAGATPEEVEEAVRKAELQPYKGHKATSDWKRLIALKEQQEKEDHEKAIRKREEERDAKCIAAIQNLMQLDEDEAHEKRQKSLKQNLADIKEEEEFILHQLHLMYKQEKKKQRKKKGEEEWKEEEEKRRTEREQKEKDREVDRKVRKRNEQRKKKEEERKEEEEKKRREQKEDEERKEEERSKEEERVEERRKSRRLAKYQAASKEAKIKLAVALEQLEASRAQKQGASGSKLQPEPSTAGVVPNQDSTS